MSQPSNCTIMEEREEQMVSPTGGGGGERNPDITFRLAHFLSPMVTSDNSLWPEVPSSTVSSPDFNLGDTKKGNLKVQFPGWRVPSENWKTWTDRMNSLYHSAWKKAGIFDAVMNSTYKIPRNDEIIHGFAERWCPETNTFVFPWGEATITLEDVMVLGGYSVLGDPVFVQSPESEEGEKELLRARSEFIQSKSRKPWSNGWSQKFMDSGSNIEHEAFLALWLSRFVFPSKTRQSSVGRHVFSTAVHLARGTKIALAPAVLASVYAYLSEMKRALVISASKRLQTMKGNKKDETVELSIFAPFQLVQIWVWERFVSLRPKPLPFETDQPRFAKWNNLRVKNNGGVKSSIDEAGDLFLWRPYAVGSKSLFPHEIYKKEARWITVDSGIDEEQEIFVRWLRVSELVGIDSNFIEQYLPHRVAMQFGFDQDVPGLVPRVNSSQILAWENYNRKIVDGRLYVPSRLFESDVTTRYLEWWKNWNCRPVLSGDPVITNVLGANSIKSKNLGIGTQLSSSLDKLPLKRKKISDVEGLSNKSRKVSKRFKSLSDVLKDAAFASSGLSPKTNQEGMQPSEDTDRQHQTELLRNASGRKHKALNVIRLTGSDYRKAFTKQMMSRSKQKVVGSENRNLEKCRAKELLRSRDFLSSSEKILNEDGAVVNSGFHDQEETLHSEELCESGMTDKGSNGINPSDLEHKNASFEDGMKDKGKGSNGINPSDLEHKDASFEDRMRLNNLQKTPESEKRSSMKGLECEDQESKPDSNKELINSNTINERKCKLGTLKDLLTQWDTDFTNLENIVAEYKRNHVNAKDDK
ncbi:OLC1v1022770C1 [Oldenlandia corymbosa var. corymbosa]|uniref:OLC1v1022770C1 n=1 Tax=Oldenlandia corymbosa var. corymbosa TaxID=529605 RepID=A0AAV1BZZ8_OLDCO|nr:OLC1v1022770C1 [Oldenlandia corymbosa var. corymbosa]